MTRCTAAIAAALLLVAAVPAAAEPPRAELVRLAEWMTGSFSSAPQAAADEDYFDIRLHMARIWPEREDGYWLYVEQAVAETPDEPYRQRVYHLTQPGDDLLQSRVYAIPEPARFAGAWREDTPLGELTPEDLELREGCAIVMRVLDDRYEGSTLGRLCPSSLRGAAFATSEVVLTSDTLSSWDRGFDADGVQVWGATEGGYVFTKVADDPLQVAAD